MYWETLPGWVWLIYYFVIILTLVLAIRSILKNKMRRLSFVVVLFSISVPILLFINSIERDKDVTEFDHFVVVAELQAGTVWTIFSMLGYGVILVWWLLLPFIRSKRLAR
ncbi:hypothetical protein [Shouchella patagoniensis]|uniref:hypothetical protein n=1 Tax=Shouchella patagoniensis TaxID=228576 RepID=UPI000995D55C|nr:hypothetical protein [Shouchella patagoniensis]